MTTVARLLPRHWDGRRLLQFLTGLALIALAFAVPALFGPAAPPVEAPVTVITTVDTPLSPGLPVLDAPDPATAAAGTGAAGDAPAGLALEAATEAAHGTEAAQGTDAEVSGAGSGDATGVDKSLVQGEDGLPVQQRPQARLICLEGRAAGGGATQRAHSERGPPRA